MARCHWRKRVGRTAATVLEYELQTELDGSGDTHGARNQTSCGSTVPARVKHRIRGVGKVRMVEDVEELCAELDVLVLRERRALKQREIHTVESWTDERMSPRISVDAKNGVGECAW